MPTEASTLGILNSAEKFFLIASNPEKILKKLYYLYRLHVRRDEFIVAHNKWVKDRGDQTLRLSYPLNANSVVWDIGGYKGDFANDIYSRYGCTIHIFEPVSKFYQICLNRFHGNEKIHCHNFGLSNIDGEFYISDEDNASSVAKDPNLNKGERVHIRSFMSTVHALGVQEIDLLKVNIEGGEYELFPHITSSNFANNIRFIQVQFHNFIQNAVNNRNKIRHEFEKTHNLSWDYPFIWESWSRKTPIRPTP